MNCVQTSTQLSHNMSLTMAMAGQILFDLPIVTVKLTLNFNKMLP